MRCTPEQYRLVALERYTQATLLRREEHYALAMYVSGLSAECMVRSFHPSSAVFDDRHDIVRLFNGCASRFSENATRRLQEAINVIHTYWDNSYRFMDTGRMRTYIRKFGRTGIHKKADLLKFRCSELENATGEVVRVGEQIWQSK